MGRQYVRQSFSSASCAAGDSPCASSTTLQCVVVNATAPRSVFPPSPVNEDTSLPADTLRSKEKAGRKSSPHVTEQMLLCGPADPARHLRRQNRGQRHFTVNRLFRNIFYTGAHF